MIGSHNVRSMAEKYRKDGYGYDDERVHSLSNDGIVDGGRPGNYDDRDPFGNEEGHDVRRSDRPSLSSGLRY